MKTTVSIQGMHCKSCELLIEDELKTIEGVSSVDVSHKTGIATIHHTTQVLSHQALEQAVNRAGYTIGTKTKLPWIAQKKQDFIEFGSAVGIVGLAYLIAREIGLFDFHLVSSNNYAQLPVVLLVGLTAGISTCMALVGGLVLGIFGRFVQDNPQATAVEKMKPHLFFSLGRIISFFLLGGLIGLFGSAIRLSSSVVGILTVAVGIVMAMLGLQLIRLFPKLSQVSITLPKGISRFLGVSGQTNSPYSHKNAFILGVLTFFVPCGFTQAIQLYAMTTGSFLTGALTMTVFALGTAPGLLGLGGLVSVARKSYAGFFFKVIGIIVMGMAVFNISNGLTLAGVQKASSSFANREQKETNVTVENGVQILRMEQNARGYAPNTFIVKKNIPARWIVKSVYPYSCASSLWVEKLHIRTVLTEKEQEFTFTPKEKGEIPFSCSMGMYSGVIIVVD